MKIIKIFIVVAFLFFSGVSCGKLKFLAFKGPHFGFAGVKVKTPKLLGLKHRGLGHGGVGGFHSGGYEHHEYHESHHSGGSFGGGSWFGK